MNKEIYITPEIETIEIELESSLLTGSKPTINIDDIPSNGGFDL